MQQLTTIAAIATPPGKGGIGIIRISGGIATEIANKILRCIPKPRIAKYTDFWVGEQVIDRGVALFFPGPNSFTGEDVVELQAHGGPTILAMLLQECCKLGAVSARPGEFTERAYLNNKIDLLQAEATAALIAAEHADAAIAAVRSLRGEFSTKVNELQQKILYWRTQVEACIDFSEEDLLLSTSKAIKIGLLATIEVVCDLLGNVSQGVLLQEGIATVIFGPTNAGKSQLINRLTKEDCSIVTSVAGTTRDVIRAHAMLGGYSLHIADTAGIRETQDQVESIGINKSFVELSKCNLLLLVTDIASPDVNDLLQEVTMHLPDNAKIILLYNKLDLYPGYMVAKFHAQGYRQLAISAKTGEGMDALEDSVTQLFAGHTPSSGVFAARHRHVQELQQVNTCLQLAVQLQDQHMLELVAEQLRLAQLHLANLTGQGGVEQLLGEIFTSFCVGK